LRLLSYGCICLWLHLFIPLAPPYLQIKNRLREAAKDVGLPCVKAHVDKGDGHTAFSEAEAAELEEECVRLGCDKINTRPHYSTGVRIDIDGERLLGCGRSVGIMQETKCGQEYGQSDRF
jgi:hypothetical protein